MTSQVRPSGDQPLRHQPDRRRIGGLLWQRNFGLLWFGESISGVGSAMASVAVPLLAVAVLHASTFAVSALTAAAYLPWLLIGLPAGAWVDRLPPRPVLITADLAAGLLYGSLPVAAWLHLLTVAQVLVVELLAGAASVFFTTAYTVYLPVLVAEDDLLEGNAKLQGSASVASISGSGLAGIAARAVGVANAVLFNAGSFLVSAICLLCIRVTEPDDEPAQAPARPPRSTTLRADIAEGLSFLWRDPLLRVLAIWPAIANLAFGGVLSISVLFLVRVSKSGRHFMRFCPKLVSQTLTVATAASALIMAGTVPSEGGPAASAASAVRAVPAVTAPSPVGTTAGTNFDTADPGVLLDSNHFYAFSTGSGLRQFNAAEAGSGWSTPAPTLLGGQPSWADSTKGIWAPDMIKTTSGKYMVYYSSALPGTAGNPAGADLTPAANSRCIGTAEGTNPLGKFTADPTPLVCFSQFHPIDGMDANPGNRTRGEGVIDPSPVMVTIGGQQELFLLYKTQADPSQGQHATIRMIQLSAADGVTKIGESNQLLSSSLGSFADTIEAPSLIQHGSAFFLFVAHGNFDSCNYATQWYKSTSIWSWTGGATTILNQASTGICGPGTADITDSEVSGQSRIFLNGWVKQTGTTITSTPYDPGTKNVAPDEGTNADRVLYSAIITWSASNTPQLGEFLS